MGASWQLYPDVQPLSKGQIVTELGDIAAALREATPEQRAKLYETLGLRLTYDPDTRRVHLQSWPAACTQVGVGGGTSPVNNWRSLPWRS